MTNICDLVEKQKKIADEIVEYYERVYNVENKERCIEKAISILKRHGVKIEKSEMTQLVEEMINVYFDH